MIYREITDTKSLYEDIQELLGFTSSSNPPSSKTTDAIDRLVREIDKMKSHTNDLRKQIKELQEKNKS